MGHTFQLILSAVSESSLYPLKLVFNVYFLYPLIAVHLRNQDRVAQVIKSIPLIFCRQVCHGITFINLPRSTFKSIIFPLCSPNRRLFPYLMIRNYLRFSSLYRSLSCLCSFPFMPIPSINIPVTLKTVSHLTFLG